MALAIPVVHEVELLFVDGVRAAGPHAERVEHHVPLVVGEGVLRGSAETSEARA